MYTMKAYLVIFMLSSYIVSFCFVWKHIKMYHLSSLSAHHTHNRSHAYTDSCTSISHFFVCTPSTSLLFSFPPANHCSVYLECLNSMWTCNQMDLSFHGWFLSFSMMSHSSYCWVRVLIVYSNFSFLFICCWLISLFHPLSYSNATKGGCNALSLFLFKIVLALWFFPGVP